MAEQCVFRVELDGESYAHDRMDGGRRDLPQSPSTKKAFAIGGNGYDGDDEGDLGHYNLMSTRVNSTDEVYNGGR